MTQSHIEKEFQTRLCRSIEAAWPDPTPLIKLASDTASRVALPGGKWRRRKQAYGGKGFPDIVGFRHEGSTSITSGRWKQFAWECKMGDGAYTPNCLTSDQQEWLEMFEEVGADGAVMYLYGTGSWPDRRLVRIPYRYATQTWTVGELDTRYALDGFAYLPNLHGRAGGWRLT